LTILEVGCGSGFFTPILSKAVGLNGKIIAIDIQREMIEKLSCKIEKKGLNNVETFVGDIAESNLILSSIDLIFAYYCYHEFEDKSGTIRKFKELLKEQGKIFICEPRFEVKIKKKEKMIEDLEREGFILIEEWKTLFSYYLIFKKQPVLRFQTNL